MYINHASAIYTFFILYLYILYFFFISTTAISIVIFIYLSSLLSNASTVVDPEEVCLNPPPSHPLHFKISYENEIIWSQ